MVVLKTKVLHFKIENTQIKYTNRKRKFKRMLSFLFVDKRAFCYEIVFQGIKPCFLHSRSECLACFEATDALRISVLFLFHFFAWNSWPFSCYYNVHRNIDKINHSKMKNILCEIMLLAAFFWPWLFFTNWPAAPFDTSTAYGLLLTILIAPLNKVTNSRLGWTKYIDLYEFFNLALVLLSLCLLTGA